MGGRGGRVDAYPTGNHEDGGLSCFRACVFRVDKDKRKIVPLEQVNLLYQGNMTAIDRSYTGQPIEGTMEWLLSSHLIKYQYQHSYPRNIHPRSFKDIMRYGLDIWTSFFI